MKQQRVSITVPEKLLQETERLASNRFGDRSTVMRELLAAGLKEYKVAEAVKGYSEGRLSIGKAAELAGLSLWKFMEVLRERQVMLRQDLESLRAELKA